MKTPAYCRRAGQLAIKTVPQAAAQVLQEAIISGELRGGEQVLNRKWSTCLGIRQPNLGEALRGLEDQGLLRKIPQRGTNVTELRLDDYRNILEVRIPLEAIAIGRAAKRLTRETDKALTDLVMTMAGPGHDMDLKSFHDCDVLFHRKIWELVDNEFHGFLEKISFRLFIFSVVGVASLKVEILRRMRQLISQ